MTQLNKGVVKLCNSPEKPSAIREAHRPREPPKEASGSEPSLDPPKVPESVKGVDDPDSVLGPRDPFGFILA